jgi:hypothetical protein
MATRTASEKPRSRRNLSTQSQLKTDVDTSVLLGIEPSGKVAFAQVGVSEEAASEPVTEAMLERYPNLAYVAVVSARVVNVRKDQPRPNRPK